MSRCPWVSRTASLPTAATRTPRTESPAPTRLTDPLGSRRRAYRSCEDENAPAARRCCATARPAPGRGAIGGRRGGLGHGSRLDRRGGSRNDHRCGGFRDGDGNGDRASRPAWLRNALAARTARALRSASAPGARADASLRGSGRRRLQYRGGGERRRPPLPSRPPSLERDADGFGDGLGRNRRGSAASAASRSTPATPAPGRLRQLAPLGPPWSDAARRCGFGGDTPRGPFGRGGRERGDRWRSSRPVRVRRARARSALRRGSEPQAARASRAAGTIGVVRLAIVTGRTSAGPSGRSAGGRGVRAASTRSDTGSGRSAGRARGAMGRMSRAGAASTGSASGASATGKITSGTAGMVATGTEVWVGAGSSPPDSVTAKRRSAAAPDAAAASFDREIGGRRSATYRHEGSGLDDQSRPPIRNSGAASKPRKARAGQRGRPKTGPVEKYERVDDAPPADRLRRPERRRRRYADPRRCTMSSARRVQYPWRFRLRRAPRPVAPRRP